jgi:NTE family protein
LKIRILILAIILLDVFGNLSAQNIQKEHSKPKVGLVLSGGGAKGFAHIGALKVIDSLGIKVDYVAGTSMGAIIGALYASGYSGNALDSIFNSVDFDKIINDDLPRGAKAFNERNSAERYALTLPFEGFKLQLPSALSRGQNIFNILSRLLLHTNGIHNFKDLHIPFFCLATNIETGKSVVLESGNLPQALMASSALPSLFQPVILEDKILVDGGVTNNYPIDELKAKGMDFIIGVDVQDGLIKREELTSATDVLIQINNFRTINAMKLKSQQTDVHIKPDIEDFSLISFDKGNAIIAKGKTATLAQIDKLKALMKNKAHTDSGELGIGLKDTITIRKVAIKGNKQYTRAYIKGKLKLKNEGEVVYKDFIKGVNSLIATNNFNAFHYYLKPTEEKRVYDLLADIKENRQSTFLRLALHYDDLYKSAALVNITKKRLLFKNDVASLDLILGDNVRYNFNYLIDKGFYWSIGLRSRFNGFEKGVDAQLFLDDSTISNTSVNQINIDLQDQTNQIYLETLFRKNFALNLGVEHKRLEIKSETIPSETGQDEFVFEATDYGSVFGTLKLDTYNDKYFPSKGLFFEGDLHSYLLASDFNTNFDSFSIVKAKAGYAFSVLPKLAFNIQSGAGFKFGDKSTTSLDFALGGFGNDFINNFESFLGYDFIALTGNNYIKTSFSADYEFFPKSHLTLEGNWANVDDDIFERGEWLTLPTYSGYALGYAYDSFLGPVQIKYSYSPENNNGIWYFNLGFWF